MLQKEPVTVAYVLPNLERGGTEKHVLDLAARIDRRRFAPRVICVLGGGPLAEEFHRLAIPVDVFEYGGLSRNPRNAVPYLSAARRFFRGIARVLAESRALIAHTYLPSANVLGTIAASLARVPVKIVSKRALCGYKAGHPVFSVFEDLANLAADAVVANSAAVAADVGRHERLLGGKVRIIHNGIDTEPPPIEPIANLLPEVTWREGEPVVTYVANLFPYKGHRDLVAAARLVVDACPSVRFLLVGRDSGAMDVVRDLVVSLGLADRVILAGPRLDAMKIIAASTLVVHPSHEEGFSNTILEAMMAGKSVVATIVGGIPEAVADGETGILVPPRDPVALAAALLSLLRNPARARAMGDAGRRRVVDHFRLDNMVRAFERMYLELLARKGAA